MSSQNFGVQIQQIYQYQHRLFGIPTLQYFVKKMKTQVLIALLLCLALTEKFSYSKPSSSEPDSFPPADLDALHQSSSSAKSVNQNTQKAICTAKNCAGADSSAVRSIDSIFTRLPSSTELDELILTADSVAILKTVQTLASNDAIPCSQIVDYLLELLGRIRVAIEKKQFSANQLKVIIEGAEAEIARLEDEIDRLEDARKSLWLDELKDKLAKLVKDLEKCYQDMNAVESQIAPNEAKVAGLEKEIQILMKSSDDERNRIANDRLKLTEVEALIRDLENQLRNARNRRDSIEASIAKSEAIIRENDKKIDDARAKIFALEKEIRALRDEVDRIRGECVALEIQVERLRTDIAVAEQKDERYIDQILQLNRRINAEKQKLVYDDLNDLNDMIDRLKALVPGIEREIDRQYYYCYGDGAVTVEETGSVVVYIVRGEAFANYLLSVYGVQASGAQGNVHLHKVDIFSPMWTSTFGYPLVTPGSFNNDLSFSGDFSCLNPSQAISGKGRITNISSGSIKIRHDDGHDMLFRLGACTRIESKTNVPQVGQNFAFRAVPSSAGGFNLYGATCW